MFTAGATRDGLRHRGWRPRVREHVRELSRPRRRRGRRHRSRPRPVPAARCRMQDLIQIIRNGIPGTPMPASNFSGGAGRAGRGVSAVRRRLQAERVGHRRTPNAARRFSRAKARARRCHRVNASGSRLGPDLTNIGQLRRAVELEQSLLDPDAEILGSNRFYRVVTRDGVTTTGRLLNLDTFTVQMLDSKEQLRSFVKSDLREHGFVEKSPMPSYQGQAQRAGARRSRQLSRVAEGQGHP